MKSSLLNGLVAGLVVSTSLLMLFVHQADWGWTASIVGVFDAPIRSAGTAFTSRVESILALGGVVMALVSWGGGGYLAWECARDPDNSLRMRAWQSVGTAFGFGVLGVASPLMLSTLVA